MASFEEALNKAVTVPEEDKDTQVPDEPTTADEVVVDDESGEAQPTETLEEPVTEPEAKPVVVEEIEVINADELTPETAAEEPKEAIINTEESLVEPVAKTEPLADSNYSLGAHSIDSLSEPTHTLEAHSIQSHSIQSLAVPTTLSGAPVVSAQAEEVIQESVVEEPKAEAPEEPVVAEAPIVEPKTVDEVLAELDIPEDKLVAIKAIVDAPEKVVVETPKPKAVTKPATPVSGTIETEDGKSVAVEQQVDVVEPIEPEPKLLSPEELKATMDTFISEADKSFKDVALELGLDGKDGYRHALSKIKSGNYTPSDIVLVDRLAAEAQSRKNAKLK